GAPWPATIRSPAARPAAAAGLSGETAATSARGLPSSDSVVLTPRRAVGAGAFPPARPSAMDRAWSMGMAKPMFWAPLSVATAVLMPITWPDRLTSGPPELPGLMAASVWIMPVWGPIERLSPETMPRVTLGSPRSPRALPMATTEGSTLARMAFTSRPAPPPAPTGGAGAAEPVEGVVGAGWVGWVTVAGRVAGSGGRGEDLRPAATPRAPPTPPAVRAKAAA